MVRHGKMTTGNHILQNPLKGSLMEKDIKEIQHLKNIHLSLALHFLPSIAEGKK